MLRDIGVGEVEQAPREAAGLALDQHLLVRVDAAPARLRATEEPQSIVRIPTAAIPPAAEVVNQPWNVEPVDAGSTVGELLKDLGAELRRYPLVGVEVQHPFEARLI